MELRKAGKRATLLRSWIPEFQIVCGHFDKEAFLKPNVKIAETVTPDGSPMVLYRHDNEFIIRLENQDLMLSRAPSMPSCSTSTTARAP